MWIAMVHACPEGRRISDGRVGPPHEWKRGAHEAGRARVHKAAPGGGVQREPARDGSLVLRLTDKLDSSAGTVYSYRAARLAIRCTPQYTVAQLSSGVYGVTHLSRTVVVRSTIDMSPPLRDLVY